MRKSKQQEADFLYLLLSSLFIAALVTTNLIANKFVSVNLGFKTFQISAGILPYPITFLITDILSENPASCYRWVLCFGLCAIRALAG